MEVHAFKRRGSHVDMSLPHVTAMEQALCRRPETQTPIVKRNINGVTCYIKNEGAHRPRYLSKPEASATLSLV